MLNPPGRRRPAIAAWIPWLAPALLSVSTFLALWLPERIPVVDLPMHARMLALLTDPALASQAARYAPNPFAPYWLFYGVASCFAHFMPAYRATQTAYALFIALVPLTVGVWLRASRRSPALALHSAWVLFSALVGWGFVGVVSGLPVLALTLATAERLARRGTRTYSVLLGVLLVIIYFTHLSMWVCAVLLTAWVALTRGKNWRPWIPAVCGTVVGAALAAAFYLTLHWTPYLDGLSARYRGMGLHLFPPTGLLRLFDMAAAYGVQERRLPLVTLLASFYAVQVLVGLPGVGRRLRAAGRLHRFRYPIACGGVLCALAFGDDVLLLHERLLWMLGALAALTLRIPSRRGPRLAAHGTLALAFGVGLLTAAEAYVSATEYSRRTACVAQLASDATDPGRTLSLAFRPTPRGFALPVDSHLGAYFAVLRRGGTLTFEFAHTGVHALRPRNVSVLPSRRLMELHALPRYYRPEYSRDVDTLFVSPPVAPGRLLVHDGSDFDYQLCGEFAVARRRPPAPP